MIETHVEPETKVARAGLLSRLAGIIVSPRDTLAGVVARPRWFGMLALVTVVTAVAVGGLLSTEVGRQAWLDQAVRSTEAFGGQVSDQQYRAMERMMPYAGLMGAAQMIVFIPLVGLVVAGILFAVFNAALGGEASFRQMFAVVTHAGAVSVVQQIFVTPLNYLRGSLSSPTNLSVFVPMLDETSFVARLLGTIDLFIVWWTLVLAVGMAVLYRRRTQPIAVALLIVYAVIAVIIAVLMSGLGGS